jgi:superfamily II DNA helicase RecQ
LLLRFCYISQCSCHSRAFLFLNQIHFKVSKHARWHTIKRKERSFSLISLTFEFWASNLFGCPRNFLPPSKNFKMGKILSFSEFVNIIDARLLRALADLGFFRPTTVQAEVIPLAIEGRDILARARTGSGKTAAYCIPLLQKILTAKAVSQFWCVISRI